MARGAALLVIAVLAVACGDDGGATTGQEPVPSSSSTAPPPAGPTTRAAVALECTELAERYVATARSLFESNPPSDALFERSEAEFDELDLLAGAAGCGDAYRVAVCDALDELTRSGTLVIYQMLTARCI